MGAAEELGVSKEAIGEALERAKVHPPSGRLVGGKEFVIAFVARRLRDQRLAHKYQALLDDNSDPGTVEEWLDIPSLDVQACEVEHELGLGPEWHDSIKAVIERVNDASDR